MRGSLRAAWLSALLVAALGPPFPHAIAGAWLQESGHGQAISKLEYYRSGGDDSRARLEASTYFEYGLTERVTLGAEPRFRWLEDDSIGADDAGFGDVDLFARTRLWQGEATLFSAQGLVARSARGEADVEARLLAGRSFSLGASSAFVDLQAGYRARSGEASDEVRLDATIGVRPQENWLFLLQSLNTLGQKDGAETGDDYDAHKLQVSLVHDLSETFSVQVGGLLETGGRNIEPGGGSFFALWYRF